MSPRLLVSRWVLMGALFAVVATALACGSGSDGRAIGTATSAATSVTTIAVPGLDHVDLVAPIRPSASLNEVGSALQAISSAENLTRYNVKKCRSTYPFDHPAVLYCEFEQDTSPSVRGAFKAFLDDRQIFDSVQLMASTPAGSRT